MRGRTLLVVLGLLLTACGSRVPNQQAAGVAANGTQTGGDAFTVATTIAGQQTDDASGSTGATVGSGTTGTGSSSSGRSSSGSSSTGGGSAPSGGASGDELTASAPGITATELKLGLVYDKSAGFTNTAFGFAGVGQIDFKRAYDTLIADVNKRGGIAGRKLVPVYATIDTAGPDANTPPEVLEQRFCTTFTENRVFATFYGGGETFTRCMNKLGVIRISNDPVDTQLLAESPLLVILNVNLDRAGGFYVDRLADEHFYEKGKNGEKVLKYGLMRYDDPEFERAAAVVKQHLEARGLKLTDDIAIKQYETVDQIQDTTNAIRAAALKMKTDGITHVQFLTNFSAYMELIFMQNAEKQLYRPRYGLSSTSSGQAMATLLGSDAQSQLSDSLEVGWFPIFDVQAATWSGTNASQAFQRCLKDLEDGGEKFTEGDPTRNKEALAAAICDGLNYLVAAANASGTNPTNESFMQQGVKRIDNLDAASTFILATNQRRDAYGGVRDAKWYDDCSCFKYVSPTIYRV